MKQSTVFMAFIGAVVAILGLGSYHFDPPTLLKLEVPKGFPAPLYNFENNPLTEEGFVLGRKLFYDPILSRDNTVSCASCHQQFAAFAHIDHKLSHGIYAKIGTRNVGALQNLLWKDSYMWDGGVNHLELQAINPITNPIEMDETLVRIVQKLQKDSLYRLAFKKAFGDTLVTSQRMLKALTQFTGSMISADTRYDRYINGIDTFALSEKRGLALFREKCASCHKEPLFTDNSYRNNGLNPDTSLNDLGRGKITGQTADNYTFKVPSLRNIGRTYPYMHDGRFRKLKDVVSYYGNPQNFSANSDPLLQKIGVLTSQEQLEILTFLMGLTDYKFLSNPCFADPHAVRQ